MEVVLVDGREKHLQRETYQTYENVWIGMNTTINAVCWKSVWWNSIEKRRLKFILVNGSLLTPCSRVLEKLTGSQLVRKFPTSYGTRNLISVFSSVRPLSLSWAVNGSFVRKNGQYNSAATLTAVNLQLGKRKIAVPGTSSRILPRLYCSKWNDERRVESDFQETFWKSFLSKSLRNTQSFAPIKNDFRRMQNMKQLKIGQ